jgi:hypothetical protein
MTHREEEMNYTSTTSATGDVIWSAWNIEYATSATTTTTALTMSWTSNTTSASIWTGWNRAYSLSATTSATPTTYTTTSGDAIWTAWNANRASIVRQAPVLRAAPPVSQATEEQKARWRAEEAERREREEAAAREARIAKEKADILLLRHLDDRQKEDLRSKGLFYVEVDGVKYEIRRGIHGNVRMIGEKGAEKTFCVAPRGCPEGDVMLAQKLLLETDPEDFWKKANVTDTKRGTLERKDNVLEFRKAHKRSAA